VCQLGAHEDPSVCDFGPPDLVPGLVDDIKEVARLPKGMTPAKRYPEVFDEITQAPTAANPKVISALPIPSHVVILSCSIFWYPYAARVFAFHGVWGSRLRVGVSSAVSQ
jgi:hypothetical protein